MIFYKKKDSNDFNLRSNQFSDGAVQEEQHLESIEVQPTERIYVNESLTKENRELLKLAREEAKKFKYKYKGYTVKEEVPVRKNERCGCIIIQSKSDVQNCIGASFA